MLGPDFQTPEAEVPEEWSRQDSELFKKPSKDESIAWWSRFNDPVLDKLVQTAFAQNLSLRSAALRIMEARAQLGLVKGALFPQVQEASGNLSTIGTTGPSENRSYKGVSVGFDAAWEMDFWGKFRRGIESADANLLSSMADYDDVLVSLTAEVARIYINICILEERIRLADKNIKIQQQGLQLVKYQFEAGIVSELDILQAKTLLTTTQASIPNLRATLFNSKHALALLLGMLPNDIHNILAKTDKIPTIESDIVVAIPAELLRRRPDIRRAEMRAAAQSAQIGIARTELFPSFTLFGSVGWSANDNGDNELGDIFNSNSFFYSFGPAFKWNLFNYGRLKNQVRIQDARLQQLVTAYQNTVLDAAREVEDSMTGYIYAKREAEYVRQGVTSSKQSMEMAMLQYEEGFVDYQRVLDSTRSLTQKQDQYAQLRGKIVTNVIALYKALGGGWQIRDGKEYLPSEIKEQMEDRTDWGNLLNETLPVK
jgi:NodT family efflux transporter outer membrane factor (OMF) lipoprotein